MNNPSSTTLLSLANQGASLSIDGSEYSFATLLSISLAVKRNGGHLTIKNSGSKSLSTLQSLADSHITFDF